MLQNTPHRRNTPKGQLVNVKDEETSHHWKTHLWTTQFHPCLPNDLHKNIQKFKTSWRTNIRNVTRSLCQMAGYPSTPQINIICIEIRRVLNPRDRERMSFGQRQMWKCSVKPIPSVNWRNPPKGRLENRKEKMPRTNENAQLSTTNVQSWTHQKFKKATMKEINKMTRIGWPNGRVSPTTPVELETQAWKQNISKTMVCWARAIANWCHSVDGTMGDMVQNPFHRRTCGIP